MSAPLTPLTHLLQAGSALPSPKDISTPAVGPPSSAAQSDRQQSDHQQSDRHHLQLSPALRGLLVNTGEYDLIVIHCSKYRCALPLSVFLSLSLSLCVYATEGQCKLAALAEAISVVVAACQLWSFKQPFLTAAVQSRALAHPPPLKPAERHQSHLLLEEPWDQWGAVMVRRVLTPTTQKPQGRQ